MFKNPLKKYQQGGQVSQEQQQMLAAFVEWLPKRVKEFQGMQPEQIVEALNGMTKSPEGQKQVQAYMQQFQQEMQNPQAGMFKEGGKLQDFICKHAKGGHVAGCGCKEDGGKVDGKFENYKMVQDTTKTNQDGSISRIKIIADPEGQAVRQAITGKDTTSVGGYWLDNRFIPEGDSIFNNAELEMALQNLRSKIAVQSEKDGGNLSRREALTAAKNTFGFSGSQARRAYANAKKGLRAQGLRGSELKQRARGMMFNMPTIDDEITIEEPQIQLPELPVLDTNTPSVQSIQPIQDTDPLAGMTDEQLAKAVMAGKYGNGAARRRALGDRYAAVQQIINRGFSKPATPTASAVTPSSVATPTTTTPVRTSVPNNTQKVLTSSSTIEPEVITATVTPSSTSPVGTASTPSYGQIYGNIPGGFVPQNTPENLGFRINSNRPASSFGARQSIINRQVKDYIDGAGLGIGTDIIFDNGRYIWRNSGAPVEVPMMGRNGNYRPAVERNGGVVKGQDAIPGGMPGPDPSTITYSDSPYARAEGRTDEMIITPQGHVTLLTSPSSVGERRDSLFLVRPDDMFGKSTEAVRRYHSFFKFKDNEYYPNGAAGNFDNIRAWWEAYKARAGRM